MGSPVRLRCIFPDYALRRLVHSNWAILGIQPENKQSVQTISVIDTKHLLELWRPAHGQTLLGGPLGRCCDCNNYNTKTESIFGDSYSKSTARIKDCNEIRHCC